MAGADDPYGMLAAPHLVLLDDQVVHLPRQQRKVVERDGDPAIALGGHTAGSQGFAGGRALFIFLEAEFIGGGGLGLPAVEGNRDEVHVAPQVNRKDIFLSGPSRALSNREPSRKWQP